MKRIAVAVVLLALWVIPFANCPAAQDEADGYSPEELAAIKKVKSECLYANSLFDEGLNGRTWGITSGAGFVPYEPDDLVYNESRIPGVYVIYRGADWVVLGDSVFRLDEYSGIYTPNLPLYFREFDLFEEGVINDDDRKALDDPIYISCSFPVYLYSNIPWFIGGRWINTCYIIPGGTELPVLSWACETNEEEVSNELWVRTIYEDKIGWLLASEIAEYGPRYYELMPVNYLEDYGGDLFDLTVTTDELRVDYWDFGLHEAIGTEWLGRGEKLRLFQPSCNISQWNFYRTSFDCEQDSIYIYAIHDGKYCRVVIRERSGKAYDYARGKNLEELDWFVDFNSKLLELNKDYYNPRE